MMLFELCPTSSDRRQTAFPVHFDMIYTSCNDHDTSCALTKLNDEKQSAILVTLILNHLKKTSKTGRSVGFKDILTSENPGNNSKF